jgi:hypothetical protein
MYKITLPLCKSGDLLPKNLSISQQPDVSASHDDYLHEERLSKAPPSRSNHSLQIIMSNPLNLKVVPNALTEVALEEQMSPVLVHPQRA